MLTHQYWIEPVSVCGGPQHRDTSPRATARPYEAIASFGRASERKTHDRTSNNSEVEKGGGGAGEWW